MPYFESLSAYMCMARPESVLHARVKRVNFTANHLRGALPMDSTIPMLSFFILFLKEKLNSVALSSLSLGQSLCIRLKAYYTPPPPLYVMPMLAGTGPNGPQTPPLSLHSVRLVQTCNVHLKHTQFVLFCYCYY